MKNDGGHAFPQTHDTTGEPSLAGMSLRDWFAGQALSGFTANVGAIATDYSENSRALWAARAYKLADAMLAERAKGE